MQYDRRFFSEPQRKRNDFERSYYDSSDSNAYDDRDDRSGAYYQGQPQSRSADPGQSSYGGFLNEDPRHQHQMLDDYRKSRVMPKGYKRSDERIREDLCEKLSYSGLDVADIEVDVKDGVVSLEGTVADRRIKHAVEDYADGCMGVQDIHNRIRVAARRDTSS